MNVRRSSPWVAAAFCVGVATTFPARAAPCDAPAHRAFDFWLGEWQVRTPEGKVAGVNRIEREYDGCVLHERYTTSRGYSGESLNIYDASRKVWHQTWVDTSGTLLVLEGGIRDGKMVLEGQTTGDDAQVTRHRISWTPNADGSVRQFWESTDAKGQWTTAFDGMYTRK
jgi:hypothetical protein